MPSHERGTEMSLDDKAATLARDIKIIWANKSYALGVVGSFRWLTGRRYKFKRPFSEMNPFVFGLQILYCTVLGILSAPIAGTILGSIIASVGWYYLGKKILGGPKQMGSSPFGEIFRFPLDTSLWLMKLALDIPIFHPHALSSIEDSVNVDLPLARSYEEIEKAAQKGGNKDLNKCKPAPPSREETWFLVNGIVETKKMAKKSADLIEKLTGRKVTVFYNPTQGIFMDLLECLLGRTLNMSSKPAELLADVVQEQLFKDRTVALLCHSQGTIITSNAVRSLCTRAESDPKLLEAMSRLELFTFAAAADEFSTVKQKDGSSVPFAEHFAAEWDIVSRMGVLTFSGWLKDAPAYVEPKKWWNGRVHVLQADDTESKNPEDWQGHLVKEHLWPAIVDGSLGGDSIFVAKYAINRQEQQKKTN